MVTGLVLLSHVRISDDRPKNVKAFRGPAAENTTTSSSSADNFLDLSTLQIDMLRCTTTVVLLRQLNVPIPTRIII